MISEGILLGFVSAIGWGVGDFFSKIAVTREKNYVPLHIEMLTSFMLTSIFLLLFPPFAGASVAFVPMMAFVSFFSTFGWWLFLLSLQTAKLSIQAPLGASYGLVTLFSGLLFLGETPSPFQILGALLIVAGALSLSIKRDELRKITFSKEIKYATAASLCWGIAFTLLPICSAGFPAVVAYRSTALFSAIFGIIFILISGKKMLPSNSANFIPPMIVGFLDIVASIAYYTAAAFFFTSLLAPISSTYPLFAMIPAYFFLKERLERHQLISVFLILLGIFLISW